jgi:hypothetical protein
VKKTTKFALQLQVFPALSPFECRQSLKMPIKNLISGQCEVSPTLLVGYFPLVNQRKPLSVRCDQEELTVFVQRQNTLAIRNHAPVFAIGA